MSDKAMHDQVPRVIDGLALVGESLFGEGQSPARLRAAMAAAQIDLSVVAAARPPGYHLRPANDLVADLQTTDPDHFVGLGRVDPNTADAAAEARRCLGDLGLLGLYLQPREEVFAINDPRVDEVVAVADAAGRPIVVASGHPWVSEAPQVADLAARFPDTIFVLTNGGQLNISGLGQLDALFALQSRPNLVLQTGGVYRQDFIEGVVRRFGADRMMFAGGGPQLDPSYEILRARLAHLADEEKTAVLGGTATRVFRL
jgi:predicted TIM-barrel fold metal-dependent hydrolase